MDNSIDGLHCDGECPNLEPYGPNHDLTAKCKLTGKDLFWHDFWIATECGEGNNKREK